MESPTTACAGKRLEEIEQAYAKTGKWLDTDAPLPTR